MLSSCVSLTAIVCRDSITRPASECSSIGSGKTAEDCAMASGDQLRVAATWIRWPSLRMMAMLRGWKRRMPQSMMTSNTGATSTGDSLITRSTSLIAVWYSRDSLSSSVRSSTLCSASCVSANSRAFWIAITAWSQNERASATSCSLNGPASVRSRQSTPTQAAARISGSISEE